MNDRGSRLGRVQGTAWGFLLLLAGCATSGPDRTHDTTTRMDHFKDQVGQMKVQLEATFASLNDVMAKAGSDPRLSYQAFSDQVSKTDSAANSVLAEADAVRARGEAHFAEWEKESGTIQNPEIRKKCDDRRARLMESYKKIDAASQGVRETLLPVVSDLKDLRTLLANDLTPAGILESKDLVAKVNGQGAKAKERIDALCKEVDRVAGELRISGPTPIASQ